ncbi:expressed unknown protein [Seminavis robusta]|uniref:Uncharacterized protein n=1 Tax=Seminavis robusta TaxID=568900 RepID=A0A9N8HWQ5_9STRA|nr:expressed unknown protein [Seminavis robusta]|eukprot:Sro1684_g290990.1 n/a (174) ;mRNA; r:7961-8482
MTIPRFVSLSSKPFSPDESFSSISMVSFDDSFGSLGGRSTSSIGESSLHRSSLSVSDQTVLPQINERVVVGHAPDSGLPRVPRRRKSLVGSSSCSFPAVEPTDAAHPPTRRMSCTSNSLAAPPRIPRRRGSMSFAGSSQGDDISEKLSRSGDTSSYARSTASTQHTRVASKAA